MNATVAAVHPAVVVLRGEHGQFELPISAFPDQPRVGQVWNISLSHEPTDEEKIDSLNAILPRA